MTTRTAPRTIDLRRDSGVDPCATVLDGFDSLAPGQEVVLLAGHEPREVLLRLQRDRKGLFEWSLLEAGPERFRVAVTRRDAQPGAPRAIAEALGWDHDRLDALEKQAFELLGRGDAIAARATWSEFAVGLARHIRFEEDVLFPVFEERLGVPKDSGPTAVMRFEHRQIEKLLGAIGRALDGEGAPSPLRAELHDVLGQHNAKEEAVLYPGVDRCLDVAERDALVARIQASA